jgi:hypothetical protein
VIEYYGIVLPNKAHHELFIMKLENFL